MAVRGALNPRLAQRHRIGRGGAGSQAGLDRMASENR